MSRQAATGEPKVIATPIRGAGITTKPPENHPDHRKTFPFPENPPPRGGEDNIKIPRKPSGSPENPPDYQKTLFFISMPEA